MCVLALANKVAAFLKKVQVKVKVQKMTTEQNGQKVKPPLLGAKCDDLLFYVSKVSKVQGPQFSSVERISGSHTFGDCNCCCFILVHSTLKLLILNSATHSSTKV